MVDFFSSHTWVDRQTDSPLPFARGHGKFFRTPAKDFLIIGVQVQWPPVHRTSDPGSFEFANELIAINLQLLKPQSNREQVPGMNSVNADRGWLDGVDVF